MSEVLDHILVTAGTGAPQYQVVHINSEFADQVSDHDPQVVRLPFGKGKPESRLIPPRATALGYSDSLNKLVHNGVALGGLSSLAFDKRSNSWISAVDNHASDPARIWFLRDLADPTVVRDPLVLKRADGTPYDGTTSDDEGLAVLPNGDYVVSSETEPSIRIFGRDGIQKSSLRVPARFTVTCTTPDGQATGNATLEGLTISPSGHTIVAAMEGALSGDVSASGDATAHRFLVYTQDRHGAWSLEKQVEYRTGAGMRIPEVAAYSDDALLVEEASFSPTTGNAVDLYAVSGLKDATDVSGVPNLSAAPAGDALDKKLVADLVKGPTLGATPLEPQANPLLDNFEGMAITTHGSQHVLGVSLISDDNFSTAQRTRVLNLQVKVQ
ncbi:esterase-like activity of phytase family protein [Leifsonia sp. NPDC058248]|uniref:esterase-like activity of phytase family protein n=1 Tax=Leifsonia sp. NPDC058248 TaxID=3346402 RepID=UPI0036DE0E94